MDEYTRALLRQIAERGREAEREKAFKEDAEDAIVAALAYHTRTSGGYCSSCATLSGNNERVEFARYPCPTRVALGGDE